MDTLYASLAQDLGVAMSELPAPPSIPPTPTPLPAAHFSSCKPRPLKRLNLPPRAARISINVNVYELNQTPPSSRPGSSHDADYQLHQQGAPPSPSTSTSFRSNSSSPTQSQSLRRMPSPRGESLRDLRAKDSEACLQKVYEQHTLAYLEGPLFRPLVPPKSKRRSLVVF